MRKTVTYNRIEKVKYTFSKIEVRDALLEKYKIDNPTSCELEFNLYGGFEDTKEGALMEVKYIVNEKQNESKKITEGGGE